jgi:glycosyltransferase involved in cell wall biosynthesis
LALNTDLPIFPGGGGVEFLTMINLAALAGDVGLVSLAHTRDDLNRSAALAEAGVHLYLWHSPWLDGVPASERSAVARTAYGWVRRLTGAMRAVHGRPSDTTIMDAAFANMAPSLTQALSERSWHVVAVVQSSASAMIDHVPRALVSVLVMHDIRARLYARRARVATSLLARWRLQREARRYAAFEREYCRRFDLVVTVSADDARWIEAHYAPRRVFTLRLPLDSAHFVPACASQEQPGRIVFTGLLTHPPNVDAAVYFATKVLPLVRLTESAAEFHIVGRSPVPEVLALGALPGVKVFPDVPDIRAHLGPAAVVVVPLRYGAGSRQKILEAWSMEKCVVSTRVGAEGLEFTDGVDLLIADSTEGMAATVISALRDPDLRARVRHGGRVIVQTRHAPVHLAAGYHTELTALAREKAAADGRMRVLLDMRWMIPGAAGGIEHLARAFLTHLTALDGNNEYAVLVPARCRHDFDLRARTNYRVVCQDSAWDLIRRVSQRGERRLLTALRLPDWRTPEVRNLSWLADLGVEIGYSFPGYIHPQLYPLRNVLVMPDIQHEYLPEFFSPEALAERQRVYTDGARRAEHICAISEFTRRTVIDRLGIPPDRVTTVALAADPCFQPQDSDGKDRMVLGGYGLMPGQYLFFPAHTWRHKNHHAAIEAIRILRDRHNMPLPLVCTGGAREAQAAVEEQIATAGLGDRVRFLGYVPRDHLPALYRGAACLLFPSLFEGFGMPVLEAMSSGCPVVCSNTTSLPEIAADAAELVDPRDPEALAVAVAAIIGDPELRTRRVELGLTRARAFSWSRHTLESVAVLRRVHDNMRRV